VQPASALVTAAGEVDSCSAPRLAAELEDAIAGDALQVIVDLTAVTFLDSVGVHALAAAYRRAEAAVIRLRVRDSHRAMMRSLELTGLWGLLAAGPAISGSATAS